MTKQPHPKLREDLEARPIEHCGEKLILVRDRTGYSSESLVFPPIALHLLANMNGGNSLEELQAGFMKQTGQSIPMEELRNLVEILDQHLFLDNDRFRNLAAKQISQFLESPVRKMCHAGSSYPLKASELREKLGAFFRAENGGPGFARPATKRARKIVGLVAPHIDLNAGGPCFAHAYKSAAESLAPDTWIVLGTGHEYVKNCFALTVKDFETPLGLVACDRKICAQLLDRTPFDLRASQYNHRTEHTIEFQAVFLSFLQPGARIVPILCSFDPEDHGAERKRVDEFAGLLRELVLAGKGSTGIIASVDFAHVGPRYGDDFRPNAGMIERSLALDARLLKLLERCRADDFLQTINQDGNSRKICGVAPLYTMAKALEGHAL